MKQFMIHEIWITFSCLVWQVNLSLKRLIKWTMFTNMIVPMGKFGKYCNASRNAEQTNPQAASSGLLLCTSGEVSWWSHSNALCCFDCHMSLSLLGFMTASAQFAWGRGANSTGKNSQDQPSGSHRSARGVETNISCGREPEIFESSCVHRVTQEQEAAAEVKFHICLSSDLLVLFPSRDSSLCKRFLTYHIYKRV